VADIGFGGAETGDLSEGISASGASAVTSPVHSGNYAYQLAQASNFPVPNVAFSQSTIYARVWIRNHVTTPPSALVDRSMIQLKDAAGSSGAMIRCFINPDGTMDLGAQDRPLGQDQGPKAINVSLDVWHLIEMKVVIGTPGTIEWKLDGVLIFSGSVNTGSANMTMMSLDGMSNLNGLVGTTWFDDWYLSNSGYPPRAGISIARQLKSGTPTYNAWTKTGGQGIDAVWSATPFSATNNALASGTGALAQTGLVASFNAVQAGHGPETIQSGDIINACKVGLIAKVDNVSSPPVFNIRRRIGGSDTDVAKVLTTADVYYEGGIFTASLANLNSAEIGATRGTSAATRTDTVEDVWLMVDYTPMADQMSGRQMVVMP
jgi:hypothetical protein